MSTIMIGSGHVDLDPDIRAIGDALPVRSAFVASLIRACTDTSSKVAGLTWTLGELHAHLAATADNYGRMADGEVVVTKSVTDRRNVIDEGIDKHRSSTASEQANVIEAGVGRVVAALEKSSEADRVPYYGMQVTVALVAGMCLNELVVHGVDLARSHNRPTEVTDDAAYESLLATSALTAFALTPWGRARDMVLGYDARGHAPIYVGLEHGDVTVSHQTERKVDAWFAGSAADLLLASYGRASALRSLRTLRLRGRRPHLALSAGRAFESA